MAGRAVAAAFGLAAASSALRTWSSGGAAFVGPSAAAAPTRHLRASSAEQVLPGAGEGSQAGFLAASSAVLLAAVGAAGVRRAAVARRAAPIATETIPRPEDLLTSPKFPMYIGSTGGYMSKATRERHAITWTAPSEEYFEMPTGGSAIMNKGENLCYFRKKEQCICVGKELRKMKIENYKIYRIAKDGTVTFLHPADGVFPDKVNKGRVQVNGRPFTVAQNAKPALLKWTKYHMKSYEADPLTTLFVKARVRAYLDTDNLFAMPLPTGWLNVDGKQSGATSM